MMSYIHIARRTGTPENGQNISVADFFSHITIDHEKMKKTACRACCLYLQYIDWCLPIMRQD